MGGVSLYKKSKITKKGICILLMCLSLSISCVMFSVVVHFFRRKETDNKTSSFLMYPDNKWTFASDVCALIKDLSRKKETCNRNKISTGCYLLRHYYFPLFLQSLFLIYMVQCARTQRHASRAMTFVSLLQFFSVGIWLVEDCTEEWDGLKEKQIFAI